jgi:predicted phosphoribosyltransferase
MRSRFRDRHDAGRRLAAELRDHAHRSDVIVLALPRGAPLERAVSIAHAVR